MEKVGVACGRFQIFHLEHLEYVLAAKAQCEHLIVGITSPDPSSAPTEKADENRGKKEANPCTFYERMKMVEAVLLEAGIPRQEFDIVPFPIGKPQYIPFYIPEDACIFVTILDQWGHCREDRLREYGQKVSVLWEKTEKGISSSMIRKCILSNTPWKQFVPNATYEFITKHGIDQRIRASGEA